MRESKLLNEEEDLRLRVRCLEASEGKKSARSTAIQDMIHLQAISAHTPKSLTQNRKTRKRTGRQKLRGRCHSRHDLQAQLPLRTRVCDRWGGIQSSRQDYDGCYGQGGVSTIVDTGPPRPIGGHVVWRRRGAYVKASQLTSSFPTLGKSLEMLGKLKLPR
jgi:hypothetical protein